MVKHYCKEEADYHHVKDQFGQGVLELAERKVLAARETHPVRLHTRIDVEGKGQHQCQQESLRRGVIRQHRTDGRCRHHAQMFPNLFSYTIPFPLFRRRGINPLRKPVFIKFAGCPVFTGIIQYS